MRKIVYLSALALTILIASGKAQSQSSIPAFAEPAISPDGTEIAFVSGGDIWTVPAKGGEARLLISNEDNESRPLYSPDGRYLAFTSTRSGNGDIYVFNFETGNLRRTTFDDGREELSAWSHDGQYLYFSSTSRDISGMNDVFRVKLSGGTPMAVTDDRYTNEFYAMPSPDGNQLAFTARGIAASQWWRRGHSHLDESEIWLRKEGKPAVYERVTQGGAKELWPLWSPDAQTLFYVSDRSGNQNLWSQPIKGTAKQLTKFNNGRVLWPSMSANGKEIVFERDFKIWKYDVAAGNAAEVKITRRGAAAGPAVEHQQLNSQFRQLVLSPDGKKLAFVAHGEVFAAAAREGGSATRITNTTSNESQLAWALNSNSLVYVSDRDGTAHLYQYNFITATETRLTNESTDDASPVFSPNGRQLAFVRNGQELRVMDFATKKETQLAKGYLGRPPSFSTGGVVWSPDGKWIAYAGYGVKTFRNVYLVPSAGGESKPVSFLANTFGGGLSWSPDGKYILFSTNQRTENSSIARIDLTPRLSRFAEDQFQEMFSEQRTPGQTPADPASPVSRPATPTAPRPDTSLATNARNTNTKPAAEPVKIVFEDINQRLSLLPLEVNVNSQTISKDGKTLLISASVAGQANLYTYSLDENAGGREQGALRQLTSTGGFKSDAQFSPDGREVFYMEQGRIQSISLDSRVPRPIAVTAELDVDFNREKTEVFHQAWDVLNKGFYDPKFHGNDWQGVRTQYEPLVAAATTPDELRRLLNLMVGELNASHSGVSGPPQGGNQSSIGKIGLRYDREEYEKNGKLRITEVVKRGPAAFSDSIHAGDYLVAIDNTPVTDKTNVDQLLENKVNRKVVLTVSSGAGGAQRKVAVRPVSIAVEKGLLYKQWVQQSRDYVNKISNGRLGYVHIADMSEQALTQLYFDLDAENQAKEGVIVDIRNNNGGFVNAYALDVLTRKPYLTMTGRGMPAAPARTQLGQRTLEAPTILLTNQHSLSDAEDFTEGYRTLQLGKVVGEPTGGWIIFTSSAQLLDGSSVRLPFSRITDHEGKDMELHPRPVDVPVSRPIGETYTGKDSQLDTAVKELLGQIDGTKSVKNK
ncbi:MAG: PD40 domain-containing protein [Williamsia sp.]|nr:PD40 domain-containing protein [Williamsia sp.]